MAVRPDVLNAKYHVKTNATYSCHNRTLYRRSSNMSWILRLVRYYAVIISRCGKLKCKHGGKRCSLALVWQKHQNSSKISIINGSVCNGRRKNVSGVVVLVLNGQMSWHVILIYRIILISKRGYRSRLSFTLPIRKMVLCQGLPQLLCLCVYPCMTRHAQNLNSSILAWLQNVEAFKTMRKRAKKHKMWSVVLSNIWFLWFLQAMFLLSYLYQWCRFCWQRFRNLWP